jgi:geranylgeranyl pyrophosphate synthase|tara:strand:+ start:2226 stop:3113 length:888 start_codon:yes stop_codon:yes gene_type:complete
MSININILVNQEKKEFNAYYKKLLKSILLNDELSKAMIYGSMNGGKRIRPFIVSIFAKIAKIKKNSYLRLSAAIECIHSYSLIHDDLPSMDNDDYRRGKLSVHKKFDEAKAILAGDALHDLAFEILSDKKTHKNTNIRIILIEKLSKVLGSKGLAGGQSLDLLFENKKVNINKILKMYSMKTSALFSYCCIAPFILGKKNYKEIKFAEEFGNLYGLIFQILDDIIDETENFLFLGKTPGKDKKQGKSTFLSNISKEKAIVFCNKKITKFIKSNKIYFKRWQILEEVLFFNLKQFY